MKKYKTLIFLLLLSSETAYAQIWTQIGEDINGEAAWDLSGSSVSLSSDGSTVAIGAFFNDGNGSNSGHVRVYQNLNNIWTQIGQDIDGEAVWDCSGSSVSLSSDGSIVAIGANNNDGNGSNSGHVRIYQNFNGLWVQVGQDINGESTDDYSGSSVSLNSDGSIVAIGADYNDGNGINSGHVRIYQDVDGKWIQIGQDIDGEATEDYSGYSVSLSSDGSIVAIGAEHNDGNGDDAGHVRIYKYNGNTWGQLGEDIDGEATGDFFGTSVSLSSDGSIVAIGAEHNDGNGNDAGHVRIYKYNGDAWEQLGQDIDGEAAYDDSGWSVSLNSNGTTVAIGAPYNDGNDDRSGQVRIFQNIEDKWTQLGQDIDGEAAVNSLGLSLSLSSDGSILAVGANKNNDAGNEAGHVRIYKLKLIQRVFFNTLTEKTYGDDNFVLSATGGASGNPIVFNSSDESVAICTGINGENVKIIGAGECTIYANQAGNNEYVDAIQVEQTLIINPYPITISANANQKKIYGEPDPIFSYTQSSNLADNVAITGTLKRESGENVGTYIILQNDLSAGSNYNISFVENNFEIKKATPLITWNSPMDIQYGIALSEKQLNAKSNIEGNFEYTPAFGTILNVGNSQELSTIFTPTDAFNYKTLNATVYINVLLSTNIFNLSSANISIYPNPTNGVVNFEYSNNKIQELTIFDISGKQMVHKKEILENEQIDLSSLKNGIYIMKILSNRKIFEIKIIKK